MCKIFKLKLKLGNIKLLISSLSKRKLRISVEGEIFTPETIKAAFEISAFLGYYAASNGNHLPKFRDNVSVPSSRVKKFRNVGKGLRFDAA